MSKDYLNAIICIYNNGAKSFTAPYHKIKNTEEKLQKFERFARTNFPGAQYVNYYWSHLPRGSNYAFRRYLTPKEGRF